MDVDKDKIDGQMDINVSEKENKGAESSPQTKPDESQPKMDVTEITELRRSERASVPTEKMLAYQSEELIKRERKLLRQYEHWKVALSIFLKSQPYGNNG